MNDGLVFDHYPMRDTEPPAGWAMCSVGCVAESISSGFPSGAHNSEGKGVPHIRPMNIDRDGRFDLSLVKSVDGDIPKLLAKGDVLFNNTNSPELIGKTTVIPISEPLAYSNHMTRIRLEQGMNPSFVAKQLHFLWMSGYFRHRCKNHVNQASIAAEPLSRTVPLLVAPSARQDRIADMLDELLSDLDAGVAALERVRAKLVQYRAAVLNAAVEGELTAEWREKHPATEPASELLEHILDKRRRRWEEAQLQKFKAAGKAPPKDWKSKYKEPTRPDVTKLPILPKGWCWASVEQISTKVVDGVHKKPDYVSSGIPFVTVRNLTAGPGISFEKLNYITPEDHAEFVKRADPQRGDILISKDGTLGVVRAVECDTEFSIFVSVALVKPVVLETSPFFALALTAPQVQAQMVPKGSGLVHIHLEDLRQDCVPIAPIREQAAVVEFVQDQLSIIDHLESDLDTRVKSSIGLRQSILRHAFTGQLFPQDPSDEPATELLKRIAAKREERDRQNQAAKQANPKPKAPRKRIAKSRK
jgi:type I restriction enzyme S subunit